MNSYKNNSSAFLLCSLLLLLVVLPLKKTVAQNPIILEVNATNIHGEPAVVATAYKAGSCLLGLLPAIRVRASGNFSTTTIPTPGATPPLNYINLLIQQIAGVSVDMLGTKYLVTLSTSDKTIFQGLAQAIQNSGNVDVRFSIPAAVMAANTFYAGTFNTGLVFTTTTLGCSNTFNNNLQLNILPFIDLTTPAPLTISVNSFDQFRTLGANAQQSFINTRTVPINMQVKGNAVFNFSGPAGILNPNTGIQNMKVAISSPATGTAIALSAAYQNIPGATSLAVPVKNTETDILTYSLSPSDLVAGFMQSGTYSNSIYSQITDSRSLPSNPAPAVNLVTPLSIQVADLQEIRLNQTVINLAFNNLADYQNGIAVNTSNHITISKTNPFDVYVKSNTNVLVNGTNSIPVSCLQIGPASGQTDMLPITLSTTAQKVISGAKPCLDRNFNVKYSIAADKVPLLLGKPPGTYTTTVTYSFTAP